MKTARRHDYRSAESQYVGATSNPQVATERISEENFALGMPTQVQSALSAKVTRDLDAIVSYKFTTKSNLAATVNDYLAEIRESRDRIPALSYLISNYGYAEAEGSNVSVSKRDMISSTWRAILEQNSIVFRAFIENCVRGLPEADIFAERFIAYLDTVGSIEERDVLMAMMLSSRYVPYPTLPPIDTLPKMTPEIFRRFGKLISRDLRVVSFMINDENFKEFGPIAAMILSIIDGYEEFDQKMCFISTVLGSMQRQFATSSPEID